MYAHYFHDPFFFWKDVTWHIDHSTHELHGDIWMDYLFFS